MKYIILIFALIILISCPKPIPKRITKLKLCYVDKGILSLEGCNDNETTYICAVRICGEYNEIAYKIAKFCTGSQKYQKLCKNYEKKARSLDN